MLAAIELRLLRLLCCGVYERISLLPSNSIRVFVRQVERLKLLRLNCLPWSTLRRLFGLLSPCLQGRKPV